LSGTLSVHGSHLHICIADGDGKTTGGHLTEGCTIFTTAEIIIGSFEDLRFSRTMDRETGYKELDIRED
jgi:predicted DNA-binding protein with PD1-like motif